MAGEQKLMSNPGVSCLSVAALWYSVNMYSVRVKVNVYTGKALDRIQIINFQNGK